MQPLPNNAKRCPNCRTPRPGGPGLPIFLGVASLVALIFLVYMMVDAMRQEEQNNPDSTTQSQPDKRPPLNK